MGLRDTFRTNDLRSPCGSRGDAVLQPRLKPTAKLSSVVLVSSWFWGGIFDRSLSPVGMILA